MCKPATKFEYDYLDKSPMFKLSLSSKELFHSNFLEWLSVVSPDKFKVLINKMADCEITWPNVWRVKREYNNFDLCIVTYDQYDDPKDERIDDDPDFRILVVIENKVKSIPYKEQLDRYEEEAKEKNGKYWKWLLSSIVKKPFVNYILENGKWYGRMKDGKGRKAPWIKEELNVELNGMSEVDKPVSKTAFSKHFCEQKSKENPIRFVLLSLAENYPDKETINKEKIWQICDYQTYASDIKEKFGEKSDDLNSRIIKDYCTFITKLTELAKRWSTDDYGHDKPFLYYKLEPDGKTRKYNDNYREAKQRRIHDLYQKLKFSGLCTDMFNEIKQVYGGAYAVYPSNCGGLFKKYEGWSPDKSYICVNYAYLHGEPLLEINVHPGKQTNGKELYYTIQVQGSAYEHGIQVKRKSSGDKDKDAEKVWEELKDGTIPIIENWMNIPDTSKWDGCEQKEKEKDYNRFGASDGIYIYQKMILSDETTGEVIGRMQKDLEYVVKNV